MARKISKADRGVSISVHPTFFDKIFETERRGLEKRLGVGLSQRQFTEYLARSNAKIKYPKPSNQFAPRRSRRGGLSLL